MLKDLEAQLDTELFDYLYHETGNRGDQIMENGLLIKKSPVFDAKNIIQYTTVPLPTYDMDELGEFFESESSINKKLDEIFLTLVHNVEIRDKDFLSLTVEDPFFNRMTDITDVL